MEIDKIALILIRDKKLLAAVSRGNTIFYIPGGKRERGETDVQTLTREVKEELSVDIIPKTVKYYGTFKAQAHGKSQGTMVKMTCYTAEFNGQIKPANEVERVEWITSADIDKIALVGKLLLADLKKNGLIE